MAYLHPGQVKGAGFCREKHKLSSSHAAQTKHLFSTNQRDELHGIYSVSISVLHIRIFRIFSMFIFCF